MTGNSELPKIRKAIEALEAQRSPLGDTVVNKSLAVLQENNRIDESCICIFHPDF